MSRSCSTGKLGYSDERTARIALKQARKRKDHRDGHPPKKVYRCPICGDFHLTSKRKL